MKHLIEFNLPEEEIDLELARNARNFAMVIWKMDQFLRNEIKYQEKEEFSEVRDFLTHLKEEYKVTDLIEEL